MISLKQGIVNDVILTLSEKENQNWVYGGPNYLLNLTNCQTNNTVSNIPLYDLSTKYERFNEFYIVLATKYDGLHITEDTVLDKYDELHITEDTVLDSGNKIYLIDGDIIIDSGCSLTVPQDTLIIQCDTGGIDNHGTLYIDGIMLVGDEVTNDYVLDNHGSIIVENQITFTQYYWTSINILDMENTTYLFVLPAGYYDYTVTSVGSPSITLETGKLLIELVNQETIYING